MSIRASVAFAIFMVLVSRYCEIICTADEPTIDKDGAAVLAEFDVPKHGDTILLPMSIKGSDQQHLFLLDTAAEITAFDVRLRHLMGPVVRKVHMASADAEVRAQTTVRPPECKIGSIPMSFGDSVVLMDLQDSRCVTGHNIDGILGMDVLQRHSIQIDFDTGKLRFLKNVQPKDKSLGLLLPMHFGYVRTPHIVAATSENHVAPFIIDTGATATALLQTKAFNELVQAGYITKLRDIKRQTIYGVRQISTGRNDLLVVQGFQVRDSIVMSGSAEYLGLGFWSRFVVTFDFPKESLYLKKGKRYQERDQIDQSGLHLLRKNGKFIVHSVDEGTPAAAANLLSGDVLLTINDVAETQMSLFAIRRWLCSYLKPLKLKVLRKGEEITVLLSPEAQAVDAEAKNEPVKK